jgi:hypothetical protein
MNPFNRSTTNDVSKRLLAVYSDNEDVRDLVTSRDLQLCVLS